MHLCRPTAPNHFRGLKAGGPWLTLGVKTNNYSQPYSVYQVQPEAIGPPLRPPNRARRACASSSMRWSATGDSPSCSA
jgi:hypothetical protein